MRALLLAFSFVALLAGCSSGSSEPAQVRVSDDEAKKILDGDQVRCLGSCPEHVGAFYMHNTKTHMLGLCSVTLIGKDQVLTNKHCLDDVYKEGDPCTDTFRIEIKFPKTGSFPLETFKCKKILKTSKDYMIPGFADRKRFRVPDWAVIQLDVTPTSVTDRKPVMMAAGSVADNSQVDLFPVYFDTSYSPAKGNIKTAQCTMTFNEDNLFATDADSPLFQIENCQPRLVEGNSGTGMFLHGDNKLVGIYANGSTKSNVGGGTFAHCIPNFSSSSEDCEFSEDRQFTEIMKAYFYIAKHMAEQIGEASRSADLASVAVRFEDKPIDRDSMDRLKLKYREPWAGYLDYLEANGSRRLKTKMELALARTLFLKAPKCAVRLGDSISPEVPVPMGTLLHWDFMKDLVWDEYPIEKGDGEYSVGIRFSLPYNEVKTQQVTFHQKQYLNNAKLQATGGLPEAAKSILLDLPYCH